MTKEEEVGGVESEEEKQGKEKKDSLEPKKMKKKMRRKKMKEGEEDEVVSRESPTKTRCSPMIPSLMLIPSSSPFISLCLLHPRPSHSFLDSRAVRSSRVFMSLGLSWEKREREKERDCEWLSSLIHDPIQGQKMLLFLAFLSVNEVKVEAKITSRDFLISTDNHHHLRLIPNEENQKIWKETQSISRQEKMMKRSHKRGTKIQKTGIIIIIILRVLRSFVPKREEVQS